MDSLPLIFLEGDASVKRQAESSICHGQQTGMGQTYLACVDGGIVW